MTLGARAAIRLGGGDTHFKTQYVALAAVKAAAEKVAIRNHQRLGKGVCIRWILVNNARRVMRKIKRYPCRCMGGMRHRFLTLFCLIV